MTAPVLIVVLALAAPPDATPTKGAVLRLAPRQPVALVLNTPSRQGGRLRVSEILDVLAGALEADTDLSVVPVAARVASACEGKLGCLSAQAPREASLMVVLSYVAAPPGRPDRLSALLVDLDRARGCAGEVFSAEDSESCVRRSAIRARAEPRALSDAAAARAGLGALVQQSFRPALEESGHWRPYGSVRVDGVPRGATLLLDDRPLGVGPGGPMRLEGVPVGAHRLSTQRGSTVLDAAPVRVQARAETAVTLRAPSATGFRRPLLWSGITAAAIGVGLSAWSLAYAARQPNQPLGCDAPPCGRTFYTLSRMARGDIVALEDDPNAGGVLGLPLGYSLLLVGGTWAGGALLTEDEPLPHWLVLGAGLVAGALAYGISAAANGP